MMTGTPSLPQFQAFVLNLMAPTLAQFGNWNTTVPLDHMGLLELNTILKGALALGDPTTLRIAQELFSQLQSGAVQTLDASILSAVYTAGALSGDQVAYNWLVSKYISTSFATDKQTLMQAMAAASTSVSLPLLPTFFLLLSFHQLSIPSFSLLARHLFSRR